MSRVNVWWRMHPADFSVDTADLTLEQIAVYVIFQNQYWRTEGKIPSDDLSLARLARMSPGKWKATRPVLERFFSVGPDGTWRHERLEAELAEARELQQLKRESGRKGGQRTQANARANAQAAAQAPASDGAKQVLEHNSTPSPSPSPKDPTHVSTERGGLRGCGSEEESLTELAKRLGGEP